MDNLQLSQGGSLAMASGALANGTNAGTIQTTAAIPYIIDGRFYNRAIINNVAFTVTLPATWGVATNGAFTGGPNGSTRLYGIYLDVNGNFSFTPGPVVDAVALANGQAALQFPANRRGRVCIGAIRVQVNAGVSFIPGTNALNGTAATTGLVSYINLATIPGEPLTS